jgi:NADPH:quinone reductase-like Zn-dependent oxidoreductase
MSQSEWAVMMAEPPRPSRMRAVVQDRYGSATVLRLADVPVPEPDETSVLVRVRAASVNALDWRIVTGSPFIGRLLFFGLMRPKRAIRGVDLAGDVVLVRKSNSRFQPGEAVFGLGSGSFAEYAAADEAELAVKPSGVSYADGATLGIAACTALQGLKKIAELRPGQSVLILAGASGVGTFAIQLAKWMGAKVTAVTSTGNLELLRGIGAERVIDYMVEDFRKQADTFDCIFDISGSYSVRSSRRRLTPGGILVVVGGRGGILHFIAAGIAGKFGHTRVKGFIAKVNPEDLQLLGTLVAEGKVRPVIAREYPLAGAPSAIEEALRHRARGKLVLLP